MNAGVHKHVVLLGFVGKTGSQAVSNGMVKVLNPYLVFSHVRVAYKVPAHHPLVVKHAAESITHSSMDASKTRAPADSLDKIAAPLR